MPLHRSPGLQNTLRYVLYYNDSHMRSIWHTYF